MRRMLWNLCVIALCGAGFAGDPAAANTGLVEPRLTLPPGSGSGAPRLALTLDACSGKSDQRIFTALLEMRIPATVFVTARWLRRNPETTRLMLANPDLFQVENHGSRHVAAVDFPSNIYGVKAAGSPQAVAAEVEDGRNAIIAATGLTPKWYRGATGRYSPGAIAEIARTGEAIAGYSLRADDGAGLSAAGVERRLAAAKDGDVIIAHVNHPDKPAGSGLVRGVAMLKAKGFVFVKLGLPKAKR